jgi:antitoxin MazE
LYILAEVVGMTRIQRWGNSQGLRLSRKVLEEAELSVGDDVDVTVRDGAILIVPSRRIRGRYLLEDLVAHIPKEFKIEEIDWGPQVGREVW